MVRENEWPKGEAVGAYGGEQDAWHLQSKGKVGQQKQTT
jgi:hypothetical protein